VAEKLKIVKSDRPGRDLLLAEIIPIIRTVAGVLIDYQFLCHRHPLMNNLDKHLGHRQRKLLVLETVKNSLPLKVSKKLLPLINEEVTVSTGEVAYQYERLDIGDSDSFLMKTYMYFGGEKMPDQFCNEIEHMILLKSVPLFSELNVETLYQLLKITRYQTFKVGELIIRKGEVGDTFYVVQTGEVGVYVKEDEDYIARIGCGGIFGELGIIDKDIRTATIKAIQETAVLVFKGDDFINMLKKNNSIAFSMIRTLSQRLRNMLD
jgi:hypothetical protein